MTDPKLPVRLEAYDADEAAYGWAIDAKDTAACLRAILAESAGDAAQMTAALERLAAHLEAEDQMARPAQQAKQRAAGKTYCIPRFLTPEEAARGDYGVVAVLPADEIKGSQQ